ncbi:hypothetical protein AB0J28_16060 [Streptosporangium canum]|uniref:hypothetical protein n=1 Tax=Streptosporangium canum TaxID=324952 RepID=UPI00342AAC4C
MGGDANPGACTEAKTVTDEINQSFNAVSAAPRKVGQASLEAIVVAGGAFKGLAVRYEAVVIIAAINEWLTAL